MGEVVLGRADQLYDRDVRRAGERAAAALHAIVDVESPHLVVVTRRSNNTQTQHLRHDTIRQYATTSRSGKGFGLRGDGTESILRPTKEDPGPVTGPEISATGIELAVARQSVMYLRPEPALLNPRIAGSGLLPPCL